MRRKKINKYERVRVVEKIANEYNIDVAIQKTFNI